MKKVTLFIAAVCMTVSASAQIIDSAKRKVDLQGAVNFRDLGGYTTTDGHHVKWGKIYRSADMSKLTDKDLATLKSRNIGYDVDLRGTQESAKAPDRINPGTDYILCPAGSDQMTGNMMAKLKDPNVNGDSLMIEFYQNTTYLTDRYKPFFGKLLALPKDKSLVFHCTAGKDRTGVGAALLLYSLGVPYDTIVQDYEATNYYRSAENNRSTIAMTRMMGMSDKVAKSMMGVKKEYLDATFAAIKSQYGSVDNFLKNQIGLDDKEMKELKTKFLEN